MWTNLPGPPRPGRGPLQPVGELLEDSGSSPVSRLGHSRVDIKQISWHNVSFVEDSCKILVESEKKNQIPCVFLIQTTEDDVRFGVVFFCFISATEAF